MNDQPPKKEQQAPKNSEATMCNLCNEPVSVSDADVIPFRGRLVHDACMRRATDHADFDRNPRFNFTMSSHDGEVVLRALQQQAESGDLGAQRMFASLSIRLREIDTAVVLCAYCDRHVRVGVSAVEGTVTIRAEWEATITMAQIAGKRPTTSLNSRSRASATRPKTIRYFCCREHDEAYAQEKFIVPVQQFMTMLEQKNSGLVKRVQERVQALAKQHEAAKAEADRQTADAQATQRQTADAQTAQLTQAPTPSYQPPTRIQREEAELEEALNDAKKTRILEIASEIIQMSDDDLFDFVLNNLVDDDATQEYVKDQQPDTIVISHLDYDECETESGLKYYVPCIDVYRLVAQELHRRKRERGLDFGWTVIAPTEAGSSATNATEAGQ